MPDENDEHERKQKSARELTEHDRLMERSAAHASRDVLHDASAGQEFGAYTTQQARDRAAHTPSLLERLEQPRTPEEESRMLDALHKELFPTDAARETYDRMTSPEHPRQHPEERAQWQDFRQMQQPPVKAESEKESNTTMTLEQQASINKALDRADINDKMGGASDVSGKPQPNDPTPLDKARDIGQDLRNKDLILDK